MSEDLIPPTETERIPATPETPPEATPEEAPAVKADEEAQPTRHSKRSAS